MLDMSVRILLGEWSDWVFNAFTCIVGFALRLYAAKQNGLFQESCIQCHSDLMY